MKDWPEFDRNHLWHPYASVARPAPVWPVVGAEGVRLQLADGRVLIDGMASWWAVIHGYNHPVLNDALCRQAETFAHVMFGGLTHEPAVQLGKRLVGITPAGLDKVFFADSGSVAVEVALKMAVQYWQGRGEPGRQRFLTVRRGYHGDTLGAMSVTDPEGGMHELFGGMLPQQLFVAAPQCRSDNEWDPVLIEPMARMLDAHGRELAAVILEPIVQGAGGMRFYCPEYLRQVRRLCDACGVLLICDEIATGFGRTGRLFACDHAGVTPDILCLGKALTGGYMTLAATLTTDEVAEGVCAAPPGVFMHGPTFMANPLACAVATASIDLLLGADWRGNVSRLEQGLRAGLAPCAALPHVQDVRVLGAIGVVELDRPVDMPRMQPQFVERGVWVRPFRNLVYVMPPYVMDDDDLATLTSAMVEVVELAGG